MFVTMPNCSSALASSGVCRSHCIITIKSFSRPVKKEIKCNQSEYFSLGIIIGLCEVGMKQVLIENPRENRNAEYEIRLYFIVCLMLAVIVRDSHENHSANFLDKYFLHSIQLGRTATNKAIQGIFSLS